MRSASGAAADVESRLGDDKHGPLRLWLRMLSVTNLIETEVRSRLRLEFGITLPRFDLMAQLERHPGGLRMGELSKRMMVTGGNVTGLAARLEEEGLIERRAVREDRRAVTLRLTPGGRREFARQSAAHEEWVAELLGGLSATDRAALLRLLDRTRRGVRTAISEGGA